MASRRMIDPSFWQSETIARLPLSARYLFIGLFSNADDQGRMKANPALIRSKVYPLDDVSLVDIQLDLDKLEAGEFIVRYETDGSRYLQVINWWKHQHPTWAWPSDLPAPEGWTDQACYRKGNTVIKSNWPSDEAESEPASGGNGPIVAPSWPHNEVAVTLPPSTSTSISTSGSTALEVEQALALDRATKSQNLPAASPDALALLLALPMEEPNASKVATAGLDWVQGWLEEFERRKRNGRPMNNPPGLLYRMFTAGQSPPARDGPPGTDLAAYRAAAMKYPEVMTG